MNGHLNHLRKLFVYVILTALLLGSLKNVHAQPVPGEAQEKVRYEFENGAKVGHGHIGMVCKTLIDSEGKEFAKNNRNRRRTRNQRNQRRMKNRRSPKSRSPNCPSWRSATGFLRTARRRRRARFPSYK